MISSQDGTEDRRPRAALRLWRAVCSAPASACAAASPVAAGGSATVSAAGGGAAVMVFAHALRSDQGNRGGLPGRGLRPGVPLRGGRAGHLSPGLGRHRYRGRRRRGRYRRRRGGLGGRWPDRRRRRPLVPGVAEPRGQPGDRRLARRRGRGLRRLGARQRHARGVVVIRQHMPAPRVEDPFGRVQATAGGEGELDLPAAVAALLRVPLRVVRVAADRVEPLGHDLAQPRARCRISVAADRRGLRLVRHVGTLGQDRSLEPAHALDGDAGRVRDFFHRFPGPDSCLDLLGSQRALHFDLVLREPGGLAQSHRPEPLVYRQHETCAPPGDGEDRVPAVLAYRDEAQFLHRRPFCSDP